MMIVSLKKDPGDPLNDPDPDIDPHRNVPMPSACTRICFAAIQPIMTLIGINPEFMT